MKGKVGGRCAEKRRTEGLGASTRKIHGHEIRKRTTMPECIHMILRSMKHGRMLYLGALALKGKERAL